MPRRLAALDCTRKLYGTPEQQEFFSQGSFSGVRVRNNGERTPLVQLGLQIDHGLGFFNESGSVPHLLSGLA